MSSRSYVTIGPRMTPMVKYLVIACVVAFLIQIAAQRIMIEFFGLTPALVIYNFYIWQPFTYLFLHAGALHLLFNMFGLWMFGSELESYWGSRKFLGFFFFTGAGAGLLSVLVHPSSSIPTIGASGAVYGILMAYGMMFPDRMVYLNFLLPVKVKYFVAILGAIAFLSALFATTGTAVDHFAHLGGMAFGFIYMKGWIRPSAIRESYYRWRLQRMERRFRVYQGGRQFRQPPRTPPNKRKSKDDFWIN